MDPNNEKQSLKRKCSPKRSDSERLEKMARLYIEEAMTKAVIRNCPTCETPIVKSEGCDIVECPCGETFCYSCGREVLDCKLTCRLAQRKTTYRAACSARRKLRRLYPTLKFTQCVSLFQNIK